MFTGVGCDQEEEPGCECMEGYFKNSDGHCVSAGECSITEGKNKNEYIFFFINIIILHLRKKKT